MADNRNGCEIRFIEKESSVHFSGMKATQTRVPKGPLFIEEFIISNFDPEKLCIKLKRPTGFNFHLFQKNIHFHLVKHVYHRAVK